MPAYLVECVTCRKQFSLENITYNNICLNDKEIEGIAPARRWKMCIFCKKCSPKYKSPPKNPSLFD